MSREKDPPSAPAPGDGWLQSSISVGRTAAPLRGQVTDLLRDAILDLSLEPGRRLIERELIEALGVSRSTIREALRQLEAEGLVFTIPQRGVFVFTMSQEEAREVYEVRSALEALAARRFAERATDDQVRQLRERVSAYEALTKRSDDIPELLEAKDGFYEVLLEGAGNNTIKSVLTGLQARVKALRAKSMSRPGRALEAAGELHAIVDAIEARDPEAAARSCADHLVHAAESGLDRPPSAEG